MSSTGSRRGRGLHFDSIGLAKGKRPFWKREQAALHFMKGAHEAKNENYGRHEAREVDGLRTKKDGGNKPVP